MALGLAAATGGYVISRQQRASRPLIVSGQSQRARKIASLRAYAARGELGSLVPQTDAILAIREEFLQRVIDRSLPLRQYFQNGRYVARLDSAAVRLDSGLALITLAGRGMLAGQEDSPLYADLLLQGLMTITGVDPDSGTLQASLVITDVSARRARPQDLQSLLNPVAGYFGHLRAEDWNRNRQRVHLPLRVDREFVLPAIDGDVTVPESRIPISVRVSAVTTLSGRMAV
ncbi:MAG TPA: hypothetical protein VGQ24_03365, partial [Gemmatimonadales bacterium]|nr:hypothetical protein [Gemmatimonadales bacterium]